MVCVGEMKRVPMSSPRKTLTSERGWCPVVTTAARTPACGTRMHAHGAGCACACACAWDGDEVAWPAHDNTRRPVGGLLAPAPFAIAVHVASTSARIPSADSRVRPANSPRPPSLSMSWM